MDCIKVISTYSWKDCQEQGYKTRIEQDDHLKKK